jgi:hypothetical protein
MLYLWHHVAGDVAEDHTIHSFLFTVIAKPFQRYVVLFVTAGEGLLTCDFFKMLEIETLHLF